MKGLPDAIDIEALSQSVSKGGDFMMAEDELRAAVQVLDAEQAVLLYERILDTADRLEDEWRDDFVDAFPDSEDLLPPPMF